MDELSHHFSYVPKSTDMMFATLQAFGLAEFFRRINSSKSDLEILIEDIGAAFRISVNITLEEMYSLIVENGLPNILPALIPADLIVPPEEGKKPRYDSILSRYLPDNFQGQTVSYTRDRQTSEENLFIQYLSRGDPLFPLWKYICNFNSRAATQRAYPLCVHAWHSHTLHVSTAQGLFETITQLYDGTTDRDLVEARWARSIKPRRYQGFAQFSWRRIASKVTALSLLSPSTVTGNANPSARTGITREPQLVFWVEMYLAFIGLLCVAMPYEIEDGGLLLAYPQIEALEFLDFCTFMESYRVRKDYTDLWKQSAYTNRQKTELLIGFSFFGAFTEREKRKSGRGSQDQKNMLNLAISRYKETRSNIFIPFGGSTFSQNNIIKYVPYLKKFTNLIHSIPDENRLLISLLDCAIRKNIVTDWLEFFCKYNLQEYQTKLTKQFVENILIQADKEATMAKNPPNYTEMLQSKGFMAIAEAINICTEKAAYLKNSGRETRLKVWYNLDQRLLRHARDPDKFLEDVARFIVDYQKERSRILGNTKRVDYVPEIRLEAVNDLFELIPKFGSSVVAHALVAIGYSSHIKLKTENQTPIDEDV